MEKTYPALVKGFSLSVKALPALNKSFLLPEKPLLMLVKSYSALVKELLVLVKSFSDSAISSPALASNISTRNTADFTPEIQLFPVVWPGQSGTNSSSTSLPKFPQHGFYPTRIG
ncbi:hypothetical protein [Hymenobacter segetis]